jgi:3-hydroxyisobutyrate dehydrogenase-like beta-hydroxyacid dehydrogenase
MSTGLSSVGVIGLGVMGAPMTRNLLAAAPGVPVSVYGRTQAKLVDLVAAGATAVPTPRELAEASEMVLVVLPDLPDLEGLLDGPDGLVAGVRRRTVLVVSSTVSPAGIRALAARLDERTAGLLRVVDAPVSGGEDGAVAGTLSIMVGGDSADCESVRPVLATMGTPVRLGPLGAGQTAKACNQMIVAATMLALGEAAVIAERSGLDLAALFELLGGGYAGSRMLESRKQRLVEKDHSPSGAAKFMLKDLGFAAAAAEETATATRQLPALRAAFAELVERGHGDEDISVVQAYIAGLER